MYPFYCTVTLIDFMSWFNDFRCNVTIDRRLWYYCLLISPLVLHICTETEMSSFWRNFHHWLHRKLSKWQLSVQSVIKISSKWQHFRFSDVSLNFIGISHLDRDEMDTIPQKAFFKRIFFNGNVWISIKTSSKFVPKSQIKKIPTLVQVMARYPPGTKPSFKSVIDSHQSPQRNRFQWETYRNLPDFVYKIALKVTACNFAAIVSVGRWVNWRIEAWRRRYASVKCVTISSGDAVCVHWKRRNKNSVNFETKCQHFLSRQCIWKCLQNGGYS